MSPRTVPTGFEDFCQSFKHWRIFTLLGLHRVKGNYKRTVLGDFWVTLSLAIRIITIGVVFSFIFESSRADYIPHLALGFIFFGLITANINFSCKIWVQAAGIIKQLPIPLHTHLLQLYWQNLILLGHNLVILPGIWWYAKISPDWYMCWALLGILIVQLNVSWMSLLVAVVCARYRDLAQIITNLMQISYFLTPIMWTPDRILGKARLRISWINWDGSNWRWKETYLELLDLNPFYHLIEIVRAPLLLKPVQDHHWIISLAMMVIGWLLALLVFQKARPKIVYWL